MPLVKLLILILLASLYRDVLFQGYTSRYNTSAMPITKDAKTSLHTLFNYSLIDLDAPFTWQDCVIHNGPVACGLEEGCRFPVQCDTTFCKEAHSYNNPKCPSLNITSKYGCKICAFTPLNPISKSCKLSQLTTILMTFWGTDGHSPSSSAHYPIYGFGSEFVVSCAPSSLLKSLPEGAHSVEAFSWSTLALPRQVQNIIPNVADKFALCLSSSSKAPGVTFLGEGPFYFTSFPNLDLRSILSYTPMIRKHNTSLGYYIRINRISINGISIPLQSLKSGSVKLSTVVPYTKLRSDIYKALVYSFAMATKSIPRMKSVQPFSFCLKSSAVGSVEKGFRVPKIGLETESGKIWTISGDNSMKRVGNGTVCLAFIDGGLKMKDVIVIGMYQMENNFLFFDLGNQKLGFSSSLLARGTSCSSFNFTYVPEY
ncbi:putative aspartic peptidase A1 family, aspartic peptidase domain superfamily, xylanase inhibitor [Helianthus annuus]|uniref:Aspartic peptidase A1 family, aspartic peptidase domain superfamily, xylanase inhibitor n=1 Tax=Helianthus annuus TaxID=4232 RepID=A0A9K3JEH7_HELAN|nr:chitinase CLP-like [Helianthus annuus]KAF5813482.1 putative aspartic peptidase A1 family, aspartic peptidase domain superfamily, xylanase inhibitor [Helianthus annuus]